MGFMRRETGVDILDLTLLQKRGLLKVPSQSRGPDVLDLTKGGLTPPSPPELPTPAPSHVTPLPTFFDLPNPNAAPTSTPFVDSPFSMLDTLASTSAPVTNTAQLGRDVDAAAFNALKIKMDDMEFKLERLVEKFSLLDDRLTKGSS